MDEELQALLIELGQFTQLTQYDVELCVEGFMKSLYMEQGGRVR